MQEHIQLFQETDLQAATIRCRQFALNAGLTPIATQKLATAVSELTRNVYKYAQCKGRVDLLLIKTTDGDYVQVDVIDHGPALKILIRRWLTTTAALEHWGSGYPVCAVWLTILRSNQLLGRELM